MIKRTDAADMPATVPLLAGSFALMIIGATALLQGATITGLVLTGIAASIIWYSLRPTYHNRPDWISDENLTREEKLARFDALNPEPTVGPKNEEQK